MKIGPPLACILLSAITLAGGCERGTVCEDGIMLEKVSIGKTYAERIPWRITLLEIDQAKQRCLFEIENAAQGTKYSQWAGQGEYLRLDEEQGMSRIVLHRVEKAKAVLGIPYGHVYEAYRLK